MASSRSITALEIIVSAYAGEALPEPRICRLQKRTGITIGRNPSNDLVLDDPARQVSRFQAKVTAKQAGAELCNVSSQSCVLVNGEEIKPGDTTQVQIGDNIVMGRFLLELRAGEEMAEQAADEPDLTPATATEPAPPTLSAPIESDVQIPDDYDVFAAPQIEQAQPAELLVNALSDFNDSQSQALLQELDSAPDVAPQSLLDEQPADGGALLGLVEDKLDPMQLFGMTPAEQTGETLPLDHAPEMERYIKLPGNEAPEPEPTPPAQDATPTPTYVPAAGTDALREALAKGAGLPAEALPELTPELMLELGAILKAMSDGTVKLMHSRSMTKHEMRANVTIIASAGNNPIKFAPDGTAALQQMLGKRFSGFMQPIAAIEDAFDDLCAHQLGLLAGARRAALELIAKLNPEQTREEHEASGILEGMLPWVREAKLWRKHQRRYKIIAEDQEGLASLIEKSFVRSYEEEIERIYTGRER